MSSSIQHRCRIFNPASGIYLSTNKEINKVVLHYLSNFVLNVHLFIHPLRGAWYSQCSVLFQLFSDGFMEDPVLVRELGMSVVRSAEEQERKQGKDRQLFMLKMFCTLLELVTLRHRIIESASETEHLSQLSWKAILPSS